VAPSIQRPPMPPKTMSPRAAAEVRTLLSRRQRPMANPTHGAVGIAVAI
jgi:hypothetical protein